MPDKDAQNPEIVPTGAALGARLPGVDLSNPPMALLADALYRFRVLIFPEQDLTPDGLVAFARHWGDLYYETYDRLLLDGHPAIMRVGNTGPALEEEAFRNGASFWHTDRAYAPDCNAVTMLYCIEAPAAGGETWFADTIAAYARLDDERKDRIDGLTACHWYGAGDREDWELGVHPMEDGQAGRLPDAGRHPVARPHSVSGERALHAISGSIIEVEGLDEAEWKPLVRDLKRHAIENRFQYRHRYRPGDLVLWDNTATLHYAPPIGPAVDGESRRLLYRVIATGLPWAVRHGAKDRAS